MSYYISVTKNIFDRKADNIFYFDGLSVCLLKNKEENHLFDLPDSMFETPIMHVVDYMFRNNIQVAEILLPDFDGPLIDETFEFLADYLSENDVSIGLLVDDESFIHRYGYLIEEYGITCAGLKKYAKDNRSSAPCPPPSGSDEPFNLLLKATEELNKELDAREEIKTSKTSFKPAKKKEDKTGLDMDKPFADILVDCIIASGKNNVQIYTDAGITRKLFSKILCNRNSIPKKDTVICLAIGLELSYDNAIKFINSAGYMLSKSIVFDTVVIKFLRKGIYDIDLINDELNARQCQLLGWRYRG